METFADGYREPIRGAAYKTNPCTAMTDVISIGGCSCIHLVNGLTDYLFFLSFYLLKVSIGGLGCARVPFLPVNSGDNLTFSLLNVCTAKPNSPFYASETQYSGWLCVDSTSAWKRLTPEINHCLEASFEEYFLFISLCT